MKKLAVVITTYNRRELVDSCIESLLLSNMLENMDIYVVDNAGDDGTYDYLKNKYGNRIYIVHLSHNKGSCGGFSAGANEALKQEYQYIALCDDDIVVASDALKRMVEFVEIHPEVGVVGPLTFRMDRKDIVQEYGTYLGWQDEFNIKVENYARKWDDKKYPDYMYVDYIPACLMLMRTELYIKAGGVSLDYGAYFDDVDLGHKIVLLGYKIAVYSQAKIWHGKLSAVGIGRTTTYKDYYLNRSKILFYLRYTKEEKLRDVCKIYLEKMFELVESARYRKDFNTMEAILSALVDGFSGKFGRVPDEDIMLEKKKYKSLLDICKDNNDLYIESAADGWFLMPLIEESEINIWVNPIQYSTIYKELESYGISEDRLKRIGISVDSTKDIMKICQIEWMGKVRYVSGYTYIDKYGNIVENKEGVKFFVEAEARKNNLINNYLEIVVAKAHRLRKKWRKEGKYDFLTSE